MTEVEVVDRIERSSGGKVRDLICELPPLHAISNDPLRRAVGHVPRTFQGRTVLFAWELGAGMGHLQQLLPLAKALREHGLRTIFVVRELEFAGPILQAQGFEVLQAPQCEGREAPRESGFVASFADILALHGFADVDDLAPVVSRWQEILDQVRPDLIVCDHSPTLCLTSYGVIPTLVVGNGFTVPPISQPTFPPLIPGQALRVPEPQLLAVIQEVQRRRGRTAPQTLPGLFPAGNSFVTALSELDPYQEDRTEPVIGPLERLGIPVPPPERPIYFAYLNGAQVGIEKILTGLLRSGHPGEVYLRDTTASQRALWRKYGVNVLEQMPPIGDALSRATVAVHHASGGTSQHALSIGRPQLLLPTQLEQTLNSQLLQQLGVGEYLIPFLDPDVIASQLRLLANPQYSEQAWARACQVQGRGLSNTLTRVLAHCFTLLKTSSLTECS